MPDLQPGDRVDGQSGPIPVRSVRMVDDVSDVYNLEVHGHHVYRITTEGVLVHNSCLKVPFTSTYSKMSKLLSGFAFEANHLNQVAVYGKPSVLRLFGKKIPKNKAASMAIEGSIRVRNSAHWKFHKSLDDFFEPYRRGGALWGQKPTNAQYGEAMQQALLDAGEDLHNATLWASIARAERLFYKFADNAKVPRIPRRTIWN